MLDGIPSKNEEKIIQKAIRGESSAFGLLYDKYHKRIYRFVYLKVSHREEAEDLTHQVFLKAWQNIENFTFQGFPFSSWLYQIARNQVIDHYRSKRAPTSIEEIEEIEIVTLEYEKIIDNKDSLEKIREAIPLLPQEQQDVIIMKFIEEIPTKEIAEIMEKPENAIRVLQHRAIKNLKKILTRSETTNLSESTN